MAGGQISIIHKFSYIVSSASQNINVEPEFTLNMTFNLCEPFNIIYTKADIFLTCLSSEGENYSSEWQDNDFCFSTIKLNGVASYNTNVLNKNSKRYSEIIDAKLNFHKNNFSNNISFDQGKLYERAIDKDNNTILTEFIETADLHGVVLFGKCNTSCIKNLSSVHRNSFEPENKNRAPIRANFKFNNTPLNLVVQCAPDPSGNKRVIIAGAQVTTSDGKLHMLTYETNKKISIPNTKDIQDAKLIFDKNKNAIMFTQGKFNGIDLTDVVLFQGTPYAHI